MAKKSQSGSLVAAVLEQLPRVIHGNAPWYERVAPEHQAELAEIKAAWLAGEFKVPRNTAARFISAELQKRGISPVGRQGVSEWLAKA